MSQQLLSSADPFNGQPIQTSLDDRAQDDLARILGEASTFAPSPRARWGRRVSVAAAVAVVVGAVFVQRAPQAVAQPVALPILISTPLPGHGDSSSVLNALAITSSRQADIATSTIRYRSWSLTARIAAKTVNTAIVTTQTETAIAADRSGRTKSTVAEVTIPDIPPNQDLWRKDPLASVGQVIQDQHFTSGTYPMMYPGMPPVEPIALRSYLASGHPIAEYGPGELFVAIGDLAVEHPLTPTLTSGIWRLLAQTSGVETLGIVTDRMGREGYAVAASGDFTGLPTRWVIIADPHTGRLLDTEEWLTERAGKLGIAVPAAVDYRAWN